MNIQHIDLTNIKQPKLQQKDSSSKKSFRKRTLRLHSQNSKPSISNNTHRITANEHTSQKRLATETNRVNIKSQQLKLKQLKKTQLSQKQKSDDENYKKLKQLKWIPITNAYVPKKLKNLVVDKNQFQKFFEKHNPSNDQLGHIYMQSVITHFNEWKNKIGRKYLKIIDKFIVGCADKNFEDVGQQVKQIQKMTIQMKERVKITFYKSPNDQILRLFRHFSESLENATELLSIIHTIHQSKQKVQNLMFKLEGKSLVKKLLKNLKDEKMQQVRQAFMKNGFRKYEEDIMNRIYFGITQIYNVSVDAANKVHSMRNIITRMKTILNQREQSIGLKAVTYMNEIFSEILQEARFFQSFRQQLQKNQFFSAEFKRKLFQYQNEMKNSKQLAIISIFNMIDSIMGSMIYTFEQYYSVTEALKRDSQNFELLKKQLKNIGKNLEKEKFKQGEIILKFVDTLNQNLEILNNHICTLKFIKTVESNQKYIDQENYHNFIHDLISIIKNYKSNINILIKKFKGLRKQLSKQHQNESIQQGGSIENSDSQIYALKRLEGFSDFFNKVKLQNNKVFLDVNISIFENYTIQKKQDQIQEFQILLKNSLQYHSEIQELRKDIFIIYLFKQIKFKQSFFNKTSAILKVILFFRQINRKNALIKFQKYQQHINTLNTFSDLSNFKQYLVIICLYHIIQPQHIIHAKMQIQKLIQNNKDYSMQLIDIIQRKNMLIQINNKIKQQDTSRIKQDLSKAIQLCSEIETIHNIDQNLNRNNSIYITKFRNMRSLFDKIFSWLFIHTQNSMNIVDQVQIFIRILRYQLFKLQLLKNLSSYQQINLIRIKIDLLIETSYQFMEALKQFIYARDQCVLGNFFVAYSRLLNYTIKYLKNTNQEFFCIVTKNNEPIYLKQKSETYVPIIQKFLKALDIKRSKQFIMNIKAEIKTFDYDIINENSPKTMSNRKYSDTKSQRSIYKSPKSVQEFRGSLEAETIQKKPNQMSIQSNFTRTKFSQMNTRNKSKQIKLINNNEISPIEQQYPNRLNCLFIKISKLESVQKIFESIKKIKLVKNLKQMKINKELYITFINNKYMNSILNPNSENCLINNQAQLIQQIISIKNHIQQILTDNIFRDVIFFKDSIPKLMDTVTSIEVSIKDKNDNKKVFSKLMKQIIGLFQIFNIDFNQICNSEKQVLFLSLQTSILDQFLSRAVSGINLNFTENQMEKIKSTNFQEIEVGQFQIINQIQFNWQKNNSILQQYTKNIKGNQIYYKLDYLEQLQYRMWTYFYDRSAINLQKLQQTSQYFYNDVKNINDRIYNKFLNNFKRSLLKYTEELNHQIQMFEYNLKQQENNLKFIYTQDIKLQDIQQIMQKINGCKLWANKIVIFQQQISKFQFFCKSSDSTTQNFKIITQLCKILFSKIDFETLQQIVKITSTENYCKLNYKNIFNTFVKQINMQSKLSEQFNYYLLNILNNLKFNQDQNINLTNLYKIYQNQINSLECINKFNFAQNQDIKKIKKSIKTMILIRQQVVEILDRLNQSTLDKNFYVKSIINLQILQNYFDVKYSIFQTEQKQLVLVLPGQQKEQSIKAAINKIWNGQSIILFKSIKSSERIQNKNCVYKIMKKNLDLKISEMEQEFANQKRLKEEKIKLKNIEFKKQIQNKEIERIIKDIKQLEIIQYRQKSIKDKQKQAINRFIKQMQQLNNQLKDIQQS